MVVGYNTEVRLVGLSLLVVVAALAGCESGDGNEPEPRERPSPAITRAELGDHLAALQRIADENGGTRAAGTPGYDASADYAAARLRDAGWTVERQEVPFGYFQLRRASLTIGGRRLARARQFQVLSYSGSGSAAGRLRGSDSGCSPAHFAGLRSGEIPLVHRGDCFFRQKARNAEQAGAKALVVVEDVRSRRGVPSGTLAIPGMRIPVVLISARALGPASAGVRER